MAPIALEKEDKTRDAEFNKAMHGTSSQERGGFASMMKKDKAAQKAKEAEVNRVCVCAGCGAKCRRAPIPTSMFLRHNEALAPPYRVLIDTNFINLSLENRVDLVRGMMDCLYAKCASNYALPRRPASGS